MHYLSRRYFRIIISMSLIVIVNFAHAGVDGAKKYDGKTVTQWISDLKANDFQVVRKAVAVLSKAGVKDKSVLPALVGTFSKANAADFVNILEIVRSIGPNAVPPLLKGLDNTDANVRSRSAYVLGELAKSSPVPLRKYPNLGEKDHRTISTKLSELLRDKNAVVRAVAADALGNVGLADAATAVALAKLIQDEDRYVRRAAAQTLAKINRLPVAAAPPLVASLGDADNGIRVNAATALRKIGPAVVPLVIKALDHPKAEARTEAAYVLRAYRWRARNAVVPLVGALEDPSRDVRVQAARALGDIGAVAAAPILTKALNDKDAGVRRAATDALSAIAPFAPEETIPGLILALKSKTDSTRGQAAIGLARVGPKAEAAKAELRRMLHDRDNFNQLYAAGALWRITKNTKDTLPVLVKNLENANPQVRDYAAGYLGRMGTDARPALPELIAAFEKGRVSARVAVNSLTSIAPKSASLLSPLFFADHPAMRQLSVDLLRNQIGKKSDPVAILIANLRAKDEETRHAAVTILAELGPKAKTAVPSLILALNDKNAQVREQAAHALGKMGAEAKSAVPALAQTVKNAKAPSVRLAAIFALDYIGKDAAEAVPLLVDELRAEKNVTWQKHLVTTLGAIGPSAKPALPVLRQLQNADDLPLRIRTQRALWRIAKDNTKSSALVREALKTPRSFAAGQALSFLCADDGMLPISERLSTLTSVLSKDPGLGIIALGQLQKLGKEAKDAAPAVEKVANDENNALRVLAANTLWQITGDAEKVTPILVRELDEPLGFQRDLENAQALRTLAKIGPRAKSATLIIVPYLDHPKNNVRAAATEAMKSIAPKVAAALNLS